MNRTDRLLAIVLELQGRGRRRAEDLAATFETSKRTIYRDIQALGQAGVPLIAIPGRGYALIEGYFLPPLNFSVEEAGMLLLGADFVARQFDANYAQAAHSASRKIESVLPQPVRSQVGDLRDSLRLVGGNLREQPEQIEMLRSLRRAVLERRRVRFHYHTRHARPGEVAEQMRKADPYGLVYLGESWYLVAYCHLRLARRFFRLERLNALELLDVTFERPVDFDMGPDTFDVTDRRTIRAVFAPEIMRWVREARSFYAVAEEETSEGLLVTFLVRQEEELVQWLLGWGRHARVIEPESLRQHLADEAEAIARHYR